MKTLSKNILIQLVLDFELSDIINLFLTSQIINEKVGLNQMFWMKKLSNDYDIYNKTIPEKYRLNNGRFDYKKYYLYIDYMLKKFTNSNILLKLVSMEGDLNLVKISIKKCAKIHTYYDMALRWSSLNGHLEVVRYLIEEGANIHAEDDLALQWASQNGHINLVRYLIEVGANIHARDDESLSLASMNGHINLVRYLIDKGADIHAKNYQSL